LIDHLAQRLGNPDTSLAEGRSALVQGSRHRTAQPTDCDDLVPMHQLLLLVGVMTGLAWHLSHSPSISQSESINKSIYRNRYR